MLMARRGSRCMVVLVAAVLASGCATMMNGTRQRVAIVSEPSGAEVMVNGATRGLTPVTVDMSRLRPGLLQISKQGFVCEYLEIERALSWWTLGSMVMVILPVTAQGDSTNPVVNVLAALASTVGIDLLTGGAFKLEDTLRIELRPLPEIGASSTCQTDEWVSP